MRFGIRGFGSLWSTSVPALAILGAPLTAIAGAVVTFDVLTLAAPALSAFTYYILLLHFECRRPASFVGGFLFAFKTNKTCNPKRYLKNGDERDLSFVVRVNPAPAR